MKLVWSPGALRQLEKTVAHIARDNPSAALRVYDRVRERSRDLLQFPLSGMPGRKRGTRELVVTNTPYVLVYRVEGKEIQILACWHGKQSRKRR